jgi:hypothetical protein
VAYNVAFLKSVAMGHTQSEVVAAAQKARHGARKPKGVPNEYLATGPTEKGLVLANKSVLPSLADAIETLPTPLP